MATAHLLSLQLMRFASLLLVASLLLPTLAAVAAAPSAGRRMSCCRMGTMDTACALRCARARAMGITIFSECPPPELPPGSVAEPPAILLGLAWTVALPASGSVMPLEQLGGAGPGREPAVPPPRA